MEGMPPENHARRLKLGARIEFAHHSTARRWQLPLDGGNYRYIYFAFIFDSLLEGARMFFVMFKLSVYFFCWVSEGST